MATLAPPQYTVVDREVAWLAADPAVTAFVTPKAYLRKRADAIKACDVALTDTVLRRIALGRVERVHALRIAVSWPLRGGPAGLTEAQRYLDGLLEALQTRILGPTGDHSHGGAFESVAHAEDAPGLQGGITVTRDDPLAALDLENPVLTATVRYGITEATITN